jgi:NAD/NADP transhydrogenase beta subunit
MSTLPHLVIDLAVILLLIVGISQFRYPKGARRGNFTAAFSILCAFLLVLCRNDILEPGLVIVAMLIGSLVGWIVAVLVNMIQIPAMVAFQHGAGGVAAFLVSFVELTKETTVHLPAVGKVSGILGLVIGAATFSGSMVASGKLANKLDQKPTILPQHSGLLLGLSLVIFLLSVIAGHYENPARAYFLMIILGLSVFVGIVFSVRIGGADMPVLISFLNATAGMAAAFCGITIQNRLLIACGATVAASGSILTHVMCKAMNRELTNVFLGSRSKPTTTLKEGMSAAVKEKPAEAPEQLQSIKAENKLSQAIEAAKNSHKVVIIPGYGMALAQAQFKVVKLADRLEKMGKEVKFAIHPVAGRMPGHMNVLLAEAEVDYDKLIEMDDINPEFKNTDLVIIVGACDVVNPAAIEQEGTPISGMPILMVHEAKTVVVCNLDEKPGYSGVENPLYEMDKTIKLFGNAKNTVMRLLEGL